MYGYRHAGPVPPAQTRHEQMKSMAGAGAVVTAAVVRTRAAATKSFLSMFNLLVAQGETLGCLLPLLESVRRKVDPGQRLSREILPGAQPCPAGCEEKTMVADQDLVTVFVPEEPTELALEPARTCVRSVIGEVVNVSAEESREDLRKARPRDLAFSTLLDR